MDVAAAGEGGDEGALPRLRPAIAPVRATRQTGQ
jgi:hypothetical protein